jgi:outer membrane protein
MILVASVCLVVALAPVSVYAQGRIATVDLSKVFDNYWKTKQAQALLNEHKADLQKEDNNMMQEYGNNKTNWMKLVDDASNPALSADERERRKKSAEEKLKQLRDSEEQIKQFRAQASNTIEEQGQRMRNNILTEIRSAISAKAKSAGYALVFDTAAESALHTPIIPYTSRENDLTDELLDQLNAGQPKEEVKTDNKKDDKKDTKDNKKK